MAEPFQLMRDGRHSEALECIRKKADFDWGNEFVRSVSSFYDPYERRFGEDICRRIEKGGHSWMAEQASANKKFYSGMNYGNFHLFSDKECKNTWRLEQDYQVVELTEPNKCANSSLRLTLEGDNKNREWSIIADYPRYPDSGILGIFDAVLYENGSRICVMGYRIDNSPVRARELVFADLGYSDEILTYKGEIRPIWTTVPSIDSYTSETGWIPINVPAHSREYDGVHVFAKSLPNGIFFRMLQPDSTLDEHPRVGDLFFARTEMNIGCCDNGIVDRGEIFVTVCNNRETRMVAVSNIKEGAISKVTGDLNQRFSNIYGDRLIIRLDLYSEPCIVPSRQIRSHSFYKIRDLFAGECSSFTIPTLKEVAVHIPDGCFLNEFADCLLQYYACKLLDSGRNMCLLVSPIRKDGANDKMVVITKRDISSVLSCIGGSDSLKHLYMHCEYPICLLSSERYSRGTDADPANFVLPPSTKSGNQVKSDTAGHMIPEYGIPSMKITKSIQDMMEGIITDKVTIVTGFVNMNRFQKRDKSLEEFKRASEHLMKQRFPMVAFADKDICEYIMEMRKRYGLLEYTRIVPLEVEDLPYINFLEYLEKSPYLAERSYKDTALYSVVTNSKIHFIGDVAAKNPFKSDYIAWVDFGLAHANSVDQMTRAILCPPKYKDRLMIPTTNIENNHDAMDYYRYINGYICCGFMVGGVDAWIWFQQEHHLEYLKSVADGFVANEESIGTRIMMRNPEKFETRASLYENLFINRNALVKGMYYIKHFIGREGVENPTVKLLWKRQLEEHRARFSIFPRHYTDFN